MIKIDIFSGFLGAGKTTLIKKLIKEGYKNEKVVLIENEFGEIGIDGGFLADAGVEITEMNSGCICCSLVGDFGEALKKVISEFSPDRIIIEPSGVGKLSDVLGAVKKLDNEDVLINGLVAVVDAGKCKMYMKNFGEFFNNQIENAKTIILSHTGKISPDRVEAAKDLIREHNSDATIITTDWELLSGQQILNTMENTDSLENDLKELAHHHHDEECGCGHHHHDHDEKCGCGHHHHDHDEKCGCGHHHHDHDEKCGCGHHHHDHDEECGCGHHHHHDHDEECGCGHHHHHDEECGCEHHHHDHDEACGCGHHHHDHEHHHADEVFASWGCETAKKFEKIHLEGILRTLSQCDGYGIILRAKGIVDAGDEGWLHFDYIPGEYSVREGSAAVTGRICVIGSKIKEKQLESLFLN